MRRTGIPHAGQFFRSRIIQANAAVAALFGFEEHEINGMSVRALFPGWPLIFPPAGAPGKAVRPVITSNSWADAATPASSQRSSRSCP